LIWVPLEGRLLPVALSDRDRAILDLEREWWTLPGRKETAIRERLGLSPARYYELLGHLIDREDAASYEPLVVRRLRRGREQRRRARFEGRPVGDKRLR
jgi:hypothetical protein